ncbi:MAG: tetratricopeptide repeat protein [Pegethrix bostrychoides GSE-TBD4-15B]|jgi:hypothetical protein|uniref:Tetratricopeptide repeat protein n=1 Tax=Pegethrix bostrychoides GSE-TBD4-15B TaxID=2839662 RepID=A0A951P750_9CYAN|nr:tetratricopeptide repeat protein [Pegethrix bostrychoides GSE-TBD4-15B]
MKNLTTILRKGDALAKDRKWHNALSCYKQAAEYFPDSAESHHKLAEALKELGDLNTALVHYRKAIQINPKLPWAYRGLGDVLFVKGNLDESIKAYRDSIACKPDYQLAQNNLNGALEKQRHLVETEVVEASKYRLQAFKDKHRGERCVIIGNGPSLNKMDLSFLKREISIGMNKIYLGFEKLGCIPNYYASVNRLVLEQSSQEILNIPSTKFVSNKGAHYLPDREDLLFIQTYPYDGDFFSTDPANGLKEGNTVTYFAMQLAYYMGFETVVLIGVDHYFATKGKPHKEVTSQGDDPNHFHPGYFGKGVKWHLPDLEGSEQFYRIANAYFKADGRQIIDATFEGHCTIFPKVDYRDLFFHTLNYSHNPISSQQIEVDQLALNQLSSSTSDLFPVPIQPVLSLVLYLDDTSLNTRNFLDSITKQYTSNFERLEVLVLLQEDKKDYYYNDDIKFSDEKRARCIVHNFSNTTEAYNYALQQASGNFIIFFNSSEGFLLPNSLKLYVECNLTRDISQGSSVDIIFSGWQCYQNHRVIDIEPWMELEDLNDWHICKLWQLWQAAKASPVAYRRSAMIKLGGFDICLSLATAHLDMVVRLLSNGSNALWLRKPIYRYSYSIEELYEAYTPMRNELEHLLNNFFRGENLEEGTRLLKSKAYYATLVWSAWLSFCKEDFNGAHISLNDSLNYIDQSPMEIVVDWAEKFCLFSRGKNFDSNFSFFLNSGFWETVVENCSTELNRRVLN